MPHFEIGSVLLATAVAMIVAGRLNRNSRVMLHPVVSGLYAPLVMVVGFIGFCEWVNAFLVHLFG